MYEHRDLGGITRLAIGALWVHLVTSSVYGIGQYYSAVINPQSQFGPLGGMVGVLSAAYVIAIVATWCLVGRWIYRASVNAHALSSDLTITPAWSVGWYFVPIAGLVMPFRAMKEIWLASHGRGHPGEAATPALLGWWWGLWVVVSILGNGPQVLKADIELASMLELVTSVLTVPLSLILMTIMRQIASAQGEAVNAEIFA